MDFAKLRNYIFEKYVTDLISRLLISNILTYVDAQGIPDIDENVDLIEAFLNHLPISREEIENNLISN